MELNCYRCSQTIEHDPVFASISIVCPGCGTTLSIDPSPAMDYSDPTRLEDEEYSYLDQSVKSCRVILRSGTELVISHFVLYPEVHVSSVRQLLADADKKSAGFSSGMGFWGSPKWALGGAALLGAAETLVSKAMRGTGDEIINVAVNLKEQLRQEGEAFPVTNIYNVREVDPRLWWAGYTKYAFTKSDEGVFKKTTHYKLAATTRHFIQHDEPVVNVVTSQGRTISVLWENIEQYEVLP